MAALARSVLPVLLPVATTQNGDREKHRPHRRLSSKRQISVSYVSGTHTTLFSSYVRDPPKACGKELNISTLDNHHALALALYRLHLPAYYTAFATSK